MFKKKIAEAIEPAGEAQRSEKQASTQHSRKNKPTFREAMGRAAKWFRELKSEYRKIVWPTKRQIVKNTAVVLVVLLTVGIVIGLLDYAFEKGILEQILKIATGY